MKFRSLARWSADPSLDGLKFFAQRLDEMLFDYSLDSYKAPALNAPYLAKEALLLISDIEAGVIDYANLSHVLEELVWSVQQDKVAKSLLDTHIEYYTAISTEGELSALKLRLEVLERSINPARYSLKIIQQLEAAIASDEKKSIDALTRALTTTLINTGVSKQHLYNLVQKTFFQEGPTIENTSVAGEFFELITPTSHKFDVLLIASGNIREVAESIFAFGLKIPDNVPADMKSVADAHEFIPSSEEAYVMATNVEGYDVYSARKKAIQNLDRLSDLLALFQHRSRITWREQAIVSQRCCKDEMFWVTPPRGPMEKASDFREEKAAKELNTLIKSFSAKGISFRKFNRVADLHGICVSHNIVDNQLVNLWTALETLTPSSAGSSKIANITSAATPFLMHIYVGRLVQQLVYDLLIWDKWRAKKILHKVPCSARTTLLGKCLRLLCLPENNNLREQLYGHLKDFHLLRYRIFRLSESLSNRKKLRDLLATHEKKVAWQIRRIYRTRNLIVHSGRMPPVYIETLVENGHDYLDSIIFEVMKTSCGPYSATSLEQIFEIARIRHQDFMRKISENTELTTDNCDFLLGPQRILTSI